VRLENAGHFIFTGEAPITYETLQVSVNPSSCFLTLSSEPGAFRIDKMSIHGLNLSLDSILSGLRFNADIFYRPGDPQFTPTAHCPGVPPQPFPPFSHFRLGYGILHRTELLGDPDDPTYLFIQWEPMMDGPLLARKQYSQSGQEFGVHYKEQTTLLLKHTPE